MAPRVLFNKYDIYEVVENKKHRLKLAYERLPDESAMDEAFTQSLKKQYRLDVPLLRTEKMEYEERDTRQRARARHNLAAQLAMSGKTGKELVFHIPFEGDPEVFEVSPSARNGTVATGEIVGQELLLTVEPPSFEYDVEAHIKRELGNIEWRLNNLRGSTAHLDNELEATIRGCVAARKRSIDALSKTVSKLNIPRRQSVTRPAPVSKPMAKPTPAAKPKMTAAVSKTPNQWDVFISHATEDKAYVGPLAGALQAAGISTWYDKTCIGWGDDIRQSIDDGLLNCKYGIIVFSKAFLGKKKWTEYEVSALFGRETAQQKRILPIWHDVTYEEVLAYSPALAQRRALSSADDPMESVVRTMLGQLDRPVSGGGVLEEESNASPSTESNELDIDWEEKRGPNAKTSVALANSAHEEIKSLIAGGENATVEFKSYARWDVKEGKANKVIECIVVNTAAGFLNVNSGGTLLLGVEDDGTVLGLESDYKTLGSKPNRDGYENWLTTLLLNEYGKDVSPLIGITFHEVDGKDICRLGLKPSPRPVFVKEGNNEHLYIRTGNSTRVLTAREAIEYSRQRWP